MPSGASTSPGITPGQLHVLESCASVLGVLIGISIFTVYFMAFKKLNLNITHSPGSYDIKKARVALDRYAKLNSRSNYMSNYRPGRISIPPVNYYMKTKGASEMVNFQFILLGLLVAISFKAIRMILEKRRHANKNAQDDTLISQKLATEISYVKTRFQLSIQEIQLETERHDDRYEKSFPNNVDELDQHYFDIHQKLFEKLSHLLRLVISRCLELEHQYGGQRIREAMIHDLVNECSSTIFAVMSANSDRKHKFKQEKHLKLGYNQDHLINIDDSPFIDRASNTMVNEDLKDVCFEMSHPTVSPTDLPFEPKELHLPKFRHSPVASQNLKRHSRNSSILKSIEIHTDVSDIRTSTPVDSSSSLLNFYSNSMVSEDSGQHYVEAANEHDYDDGCPQHLLSYVPKTESVRATDEDTVYHHDGKKLELYLATPSPIGSLQMATGDKSSFESLFADESQIYRWTEHEQHDSVDLGESTHF